MAGSCIVAIESRKHAASRPSPPLPRPASGSCSSSAEPVEALVVGDSLRDGIEKEVQDVVGQRAPDEELHGEVVDALGVLALVCLLRAQPPLREDVPHGAGDGLVALPRAHRRGIDDVVEHEMPLVERIARPGELDRAAPVLLEELVHLRRALGVLAPAAVLSLFIPYPPLSGLQPFAPFTVG